MVEIATRRRELSPRGHPGQIRALSFLGTLSATAATQKNGADGTVGDAGILVAVKGWLLLPGWFSEEGAADVEAEAGDVGAHCREVRPTRTRRERRRSQGVSRRH